MPTQHTTWIRLGLLGLPVYGLLTFWDSLNHRSRTADAPKRARYDSAI